MPMATSSFLDPINFHFLPGLHEKTYSQLGDINIGAIVAVMEDSSSHPAEACSNNVQLSNPAYAFECTEPIAFAVDFINRNPNILPNVSLGFVIRGTCMSAGVILGTSLSFLPISQRLCNNSTCIVEAASSSDPTWQSHDVVGVVGVGWSKLSLAISSLYAVGHLPLVGPTETSDELSNKRDHPYFFRISPPDMYQVQAILNFLSANEWSYISVIYEDGSYGQKAFDRIQQNAGQYSICIATSQRLILPINYDSVVSELLKNYRARVVVLFLEPSSFKELLQTVHDHNATGYFIWVGSDSLVGYHGYDYRGADQDLAIGTLTFDIQTSYVSEFYDYLMHQGVSTTKNPWMKQVWEYLFDCSYDEGTCDQTVDILQSKKYHAFTDTSLRVDAVLTLAQALHDLLSAECPNARQQEARACITGELLKEYMKNASFDGFSGRIKFDENQDVKGKYMISQIEYDYFQYPFLADSNVTVDKGILRNQIGVYDISTDILTYLNETVSWTHLTDLNNSSDRTVKHEPQSVCSIPCRIGEYRIEKEVPCCWECRKCRDNERLVKDNTTCESCPSFMWPDEASGFTTCIDIPLTYPKFKDPIPILFISLSILSLAVTLFVIIGYIIHRDEKVIKASSKELSVIQLFAIFIGYTTVILFQITPSDMLCSIIFFLFCMSFALLYCPLLVKTVRICRIFRSGNKNQKPRFISPQSQLAFAIALLIVQVALCITVYLLFWPRARRTQPIWSEKLVELSCDLTFPGITSFLGYNIVLVSLCSVFAFMVRKLPDNFNESKFISMCMTTTLLVFMAFIPAYFTADREYVRVFLLSVALFLNHSVALIFLFIPKIYAARYLPPEAGDFSKNRS